MCENSWEPVFFLMQQRVAQQGQWSLGKELQEVMELPTVKLIWPTEGSEPGSPTRDYQTLV